MGMFQQGFVHILHLDARFAEVTAQVGRGDVQAEFGVFPRGVGLAADEDAEHAAEGQQRPVGAPGQVRREGQAHQLLPGLQVHDGSAVGGQGVPHAGNAGELFRHAVGGAAGGGQHRHPFLQGGPDGRQRARRDLFLVVENGPVQIQRDQTNLFHILFPPYLFH